jgi:RNA polymerase sigma-70 factor (ECF subfamily)
MTALSSPSSLDERTRSRWASAFAAHRGAVRDRLRAWGVRGDALDDAEQRVFLVAAPRLDAIDPSRERAFLLGVAARVAMEQRRKRARAMAELAAAGEHEPEDMAGSSPSPEEALLRGEIEAAAASALASLPEPLRVVYERTELADDPAPIVARALGVPTGTVASRLRRARSKLAVAALRVRARFEAACAILFAPLSAWKRLAKGGLALKSAAAIALGSLAVVVTVAVRGASPSPAFASATPTAPVTHAPGAVAPRAPSPAVADEIPTVDIDSLPHVAAVAPSSEAAGTREDARNELAREANDLRALQALRVADPAAALALAKRWSVDHPRAVLLEEVSAIEIQSLAASGRAPEACARAAIFRDRWPASMHGADVDRACPPEP